MNAALSLFILLKFRTTLNFKMADVRKTIEVNCESLRILVAKACLVA